MALYRAQVLTFDDREPALLMYNNVLRQYTVQTAQDLGVAGTVTTFHTWIRAFWMTHFGKEPPTVGSQTFDHDWAAMVQTYVSSPPTAAILPDLIVDEGQDLPLDFYRLARYFCRNITVFADENQQLSDRNTTLAEITTAIKPDMHLQLQHNHRNTVEIATVAAAYYAGGPTGIPKPPTRHGEQPTLQRFSNDVELIDCVAQYVKGTATTSVGIACHNTTMQRRLWRLLSKRRLPVPVQMYISQDRVHHKMYFDVPTITLLNYQSMKGLEFDTLFVPELQQVTEDVTSAATRMKFYVVMSRARNQLHLSHSGTGALPPILFDVEDLLCHV